MKAIKLILISAILATALVSASYADGITSKGIASSSSNNVGPKILNITLGTALMNSGLTAAILSQVSPSLLTVNQMTYMATVFYNGQTYHIYGSLQAWQSFFQLKWKYGLETKSVNFNQR